MPRYAAWSTADVLRWVRRPDGPVRAALDEAALEELAAKMEEEEIDGDVLLGWGSRDEIKSDLGLSVGKANKLMKAIATLRDAPAALPPPPDAPAPATRGESEAAKNLKNLKHESKEAGHQQQKQKQPHAHQKQKQKQQQQQQRQMHQQQRQQQQPVLDPEIEELQQRLHEKFEGKRMPISPAQSPQPRPRPPRPRRV